jgi:hypothetical protein
MRQPTRLKRILDWDDVHRLIDVLTGRLAGRRYDLLLVVTRGGMVPACLISEQLGLTNIVVAAVQFHTDDGLTLADPVFLQFPDERLLAGKSVLIVDDVWESGRTAAAVIDGVRATGGRPEMAVLHFKPGSSLLPNARPDFYAESTADWIVYPWDAVRGAMP